MSIFPTHETPGLVPSETLFRKQVIEHRRHRLSGEVSLIVETRFVILVLLLLAIFGALAASLFLVKLPHTVAGSGVLTSPRGLVSVRAVESARIEEVYVKEGEVVEPNIPLLKLTGKQILPSGESMELVLEQGITQKKKIIGEQLRSYESQRNIVKSRSEQEAKTILQQLANLRQSLTIQQQLVKSLEKTLEIDKPLVRRGVVTSRDYEVDNRSLLSERLALQNLNAEMLSLEEDLATHRLKVESQLNEIDRGVGEVKAKQLEVEENGWQVQSDFARVIHSEQGGLVDTVSVSQGSSVSVGDLLIRIIPTGGIYLAYLYFDSSDIGFLQLGQSVRLQLAAFPYERYGGIDGEVKLISMVGPNDAIGLQEVLPGNRTQFRVVASLAVQGINIDGRVWPFRSGMGVEGRIIVEDRRIIDWVIAPFRKLAQNITFE